MAFRLTPLAPPLPSPSRVPGSLSVQFPSPPLRPSPLRRGDRSRGLGEWREGKEEGKGRGGGERRTSPSKTGVEFQLWTLGPNCTPPLGLSPRRLLLSDDAATLRVVWSAPSWKPLSPSRPRSPPPAPRHSASLSLALHLSFPWEGARSFRLPWVLSGASLLPWRFLCRGGRLAAALAGDWGCTETGVGLGCWGWTWVLALARKR